MQNKDDDKGPRDGIMLGGRRMFGGLRRPPTPRQRRFGMILLAIVLVAVVYELLSPRNDPQDQGTPDTVTTSE